MPTTIQLKDNTKSDLEQQRLYPNEPFDDVVQRLIARMSNNDELLSPETIKDIEEGVADIKAGRVYTSDQVKKELGF